MRLLPQSSSFLLSFILWFAALLLTARACSTSTFASIYRVYPDCARACLACTDKDYVNNFANRCNYTSGECCSSISHLTIAETWVCVRNDCGPGLAQDAFTTFADFCANASVPLAPTDLPAGYSLTGSTNSGSDNTPSKNGLSTEATIGIVFGVVGGVIAIIGVILAYLQYRKRHLHANDGVVAVRGGGGEGGAWQLMNRGGPGFGAFNTPDPVTVTYKKKNMIGVTVENFTITKGQGQPVRAATSSRTVGYVEEEVD